MRQITNSDLDRKENGFSGSMRGEADTMTGEADRTDHQNDPADGPDEYSDKIRMITRIISSMSSGLRNPLNTMIGFTELLLYGVEGPLTSGQREKLNEVIDNGYELLHLINDMLMLSKIQAGSVLLQPKMFDIRIMVAGALQKYQHEADKKGITLEYAHPSSVPMVYADPVLIDRVIDSLVSNAVQYTKTGSVGIVCEDETRDDHIRIIVWDTGPGLDENESRKIFDELYIFDNFLNRGENVRGFGLALAKYFVELHGGRIQYEDNNGCGSRFTFTVPKVQRGCKIRVRKTADTDRAPGESDNGGGEDKGPNSRPCAVVQDNIHWCDAAKYYYYMN